MGDNTSAGIARKGGTTIKTNTYHITTEQALHALAVIEAAPLATVHKVIMEMASTRHGRATLKAIKWEMGKALQAKTTTVVYA